MMSEVIVTIILVSFVVGGGLFIFWPDLSSLKKPRKEKKAKSKIKKLNPHDIYLKHYSAEDALIETVWYLENIRFNGRKASSSEIRSWIQERGNLIKKMIEQPSFIHVCPICHEDNHLKYEQVKIGCRCHQGQFQKKAQAMMKEAGHEIW